MGQKIAEIKRHLNKPTERYECELVRSSPGHLILRYVSDREYAGAAIGLTFPPGCVTIALYWEERPYVFWGIFSPEKELMGHLVHICRDVRVTADSVSYLDLLLDIWFYPDGRHVILDRDEVEKCHQEGVLTDADKRYIEESKEVAIREFAMNAKELSAIADALDILARPK